MSITVLSGGLLTTVQDFGRTAQQASGFCVSGVMDPWAFRLANLLVANDPKTAGLEITSIGPTLQFNQDCIVALTGATGKASLDGRPFPFYQAQLVSAGQCLAIKQLTNGVRSYLAVAGGFALPEVMGSLATSTRYQLGGFHGRALQAGDVLPLQQASPYVPSYGSRKLAVSSYAEKQVTVRVTPGPQFKQFTEQVQQEFLKTSFTISDASDRMGYRLNGAKLTVAQTGNLLSEGTFFGGVQIPQNGEPIILLADRQTTGGYPVIAVLASVDLPLIAQAQPGMQVNFKLIPIMAAQKLLQERQKQLTQLTQQVQQPSREDLSPRLPASRVRRLFDD
ncbi:biotin-dependent carboxyltransferase family protein [Loigolactobacillus backii]|uniref:Allophanate hydrolase n=1 Tax=Loigolactobacillus backii TaxID=375175 RepID=A0A192H1I5_9LACO|nr:biotin-dependent carboxyltransferase family protein [Loigolactobacillus backii]ANK62138.1 allophanate hydrolase [Loigolactobacillus backii]ANK70847.1 allophanate hydrolase [Loigolactobacillus backii]MDA5386668.1 biotin-dependent carboxyltransferase family protein [Loigolactobacillus backii]MDA5389195.1 biotin-dependent carboxyltransferase family protein [Loigolactobacillus backii]